MSLCFSAIRYVDDNPVNIVNCNSVGQDNSDNSICLYSCNLGNLENVTVTCFIITLLIFFFF